MTNDTLALVALLANDALPNDEAGIGRIQLDYSEHPDGHAAYQRAIDTLDRLALLAPDSVELKAYGSSRQFERVTIGGLALLSPVGVHTASERIAEVEVVQPILRLARHLAPVEGPGMALAAVINDGRDPGDEHDGPEAA